MDNALVKTAKYVRRGLRSLPIVFNGRPLHGLRRYKPFFIVGSGRCGSTMLRAALTMHPDIHIPPETYVLPKVIPEWRIYSRQPWSKAVQFVLSTFEYNFHFDAFEISLRELFRELVNTEDQDLDLAYVLNRFYLFHAQSCKPTATRWGDKTPLNTFHLPEILAVFPDARVIHLIRDGRDVVQSYVSLNRYDIEGAAERWTRSVTDARNFGARHPQQYMELRYEDLAADPVPRLREVCSFIDIDFREDMLKHHQSDRRLGDVERLAHHAAVQSPINTKAIGKWRDLFDSDEISRMNIALGELLEDSGYV